MHKKYGNIREVSLKKALNRIGFKEYWKISKNQIEICKQCEFRYVCSDCRAYVDQPGSIYSKPLKCGYDPYSNKWEEWSKDPIKSKAILYYDL